LLTFWNHKFLKEKEIQGKNKTKTRHQRKANGLQKHKDLKQPESDIKKQLQFEKLISKLSAEFINLPLDQVDNKINDGLKLMVESMGIDRSLLHIFSEDKKTLHLSHFYVIPGLKQPTSIITSQDQPYLTKTILKRKIIGFERIDDLPEAAKLERKYLIQQGVKSGLAIPLVVDNKPVGALTFTTIYRERSWPDELVRRLKLVSEIFSNALDRKQKEQNLQNAFSKIKFLKDQIQQENIYLRKEIELRHEHAEIIGKSNAINEALSQAEQVAETESTVLILGETGTGKELLARAIHRLSSRSDHTMIKVNCAALPPTLIEAELFGREKGAYTGALSKEAGRFELADGSTIFLDEISELPLELQSKLLRVLQDGQFERLGNPRTMSVDVRIIAATNRDLIQMVRDNNFREDLYYRLNVFPITMPPLRERIDDIPALVWTFVKEFEKTMAKRIESISRKSMQALQSYPWPGNIRELRNVVEQAMIISQGKILHIRIPDFQESIKSVDLKLEDVVRNHIVQVLENSGWRVKGKNGAAEMLGIKPTTLYSKITRLGIKRPKK
jgi:transcriptional regulator with GAF, ATPase, and Fis domain